MSGNDNEDSEQIIAQPGDGSDYGFFQSQGRLPPPSLSSGPMWNKLQGNMDDRRAQVFQRVEGKGHVYLPSQLLPGWNAPDTNDPIPFVTAVTYSAAGIKGATDPVKEASNYSFNQICRGEVNKDSEPYRWETIGRVDEPKFCTHTLFPTKFTRTFGAKTDTFFMSYYCFYSSNPITPPEGSWTPDYKEFSLSPDALVDGEAPTGATVKVDMTLINDESCIVSIIASCQNAYALSGAHITFVPRIDPELFKRSTHWSHPSRYTIGGASLGMAVFAAIKGWLPVLYTGYINAPVQGAKFITNPEIRDAMSKAKYGESLYAPASYKVNGNTGTPARNIQSGQVCRRQSCRRSTHLCQLHGTTKLRGICRQRLLQDHLRHGPRHPHLCPNAKQLPNRSRHVRS